MSVDPLAPEYPWYTPYQFAGNKPIWAIDLDGAEELKSTSPPKSEEPLLSQPGWSNILDPIFLQKEVRQDVLYNSDISNSLARIQEEVDERFRAKIALLYWVNYVMSELDGSNEYPDFTKTPKKIHENPGKVAQYQTQTFFMNYVDIHTDKWDKLSAYYLGLQDGQHTFWGIQEDPGDPNSPVLWYQLHTFEGDENLVGKLFPIDKFDPMTNRLEISGTLIDKSTFKQIKTLSDALMGKTFAFDLLGNGDATTCAICNLEISKKVNLKNKMLHPENYPIPVNKDKVLPRKLQDWFDRALCTSFKAY